MKLCINMCLGHVMIPIVFGLDQSWIFGFFELEHLNSDKCVPS